MSKYIPVSRRIIVAAMAFGVNPIDHAATLYDEGKIARRTIDRVINLCGFNISLEYCGYPGPRYVVRRYSKFESHHASWLDAIAWLVTPSGPLSIAPCSEVQP